MTREDRDMDFEKLRQYRNETNRFMRMIGARVTKIEEGSAVVELEPKGEELNPSGSIHGGCLFTIADIAAGTAACVYGYHAATVSSSFNFMNPGLGTKKLIATSRELKRGKRVLFYEVDVTDQDGTVLCTGQFTIMQLKEKLPL